MLYTVTGFPFFFFHHIVDLYRYTCIQHHFFSFVALCVLTFCLSFLPFLFIIFFSASNAHVLLPYHGTMWFDLLPPCFLFLILFLTDSAFGVVFLLLDFVNLRADNSAWYLTTPGTLYYPAFHLCSAFFEILFTSFHLLQPLFHTGQLIT